MDHSQKNNYCKKLYPSDADSWSNIQNKKINKNVKFSLWSHCKSFYNKNHTNTGSDKQVQGGQQTF